MLHYSTSHVSIYSLTLSIPETNPLDQQINLPGG